VAAIVDSEVKRLLDDAHGRASDILTHQRATLDAIASALVERETLDEEDLVTLFEQHGV
jgi:cell division protease FtsH